MAIAGAYIAKVAMVKNPGRIRNKAKRSQVYAKYKAEKQKTKKKLKARKIKEAEELGTEVVKQVRRRRVRRVAVCYPYLGPCGCVVG